jgi:hypothetical protein
MSYLPVCLTVYVLPACLTACLCGTACLIVPACLPACLIVSYYLPVCLPVSVQRPSCSCLLALACLPACLSLTTCLSACLLACNGGLPGCACLLVCLRPAACLHACLLVSYYLHQVPASLTTVPFARLLCCLQHCQPASLLVHVHQLPASLTAVPFASLPCCLQHSQPAPLLVHVQAERICISSLQAEHTVGDQADEFRNIPIQVDIQWERCSSLCWGYWDYHQDTKCFGRY